MKVLQRWKQTALHNKALVLTSVIVAFGTIFYAGAAAFQVWLLDRSARQSSEQVERLVGATNAAIGKAVERETKSVQDALRQNREAIEASDRENRRIVDASMAQSKQSLDATIEASRNDQRAWIGYSETNGISFTTSSLATVTHVFANTGKSPGLDVVTRVNSVALPKGSEFEPFYLPLSTQASVTVVQPGGKMTLPATAREMLSTEAIGAIKDGSVIVYLFGELSYNDIFKVPHRSTFCVYLKPDLTTTANCHNYNTAN